MTVSRRCAWRGIHRIRSSPVAEPQVAAARVQQAVIGVAWLQSGIELDMAERMRKVIDDVRDAKQIAPRSLEGVRSGVAGTPLGNDVVISRVILRESRRDKVRRRRIARRALAVHRVKQPVARKFRMEVEPDKSALEPVVDSERKHLSRRWHRQRAGCCDRAGTGTRASRWQTGGRLEGRERN